MAGHSDINNFGHLCILTETNYFISNLYQRYRGELPGFGPLTVNLNIDAKTNGIDINNMLT